MTSVGTTYIDKSACKKQGKNIVKNDNFSRQTILIAYLNYSLKI